METIPPALRRDTRPALLDLADDGATDGGLVGAKAANLAVARRAGLPVLPGTVLTTAWDHRGWSHPARRDRTGPARDALAAASDGGTRTVVVRSSSTNEDGAGSSMAGVFTSVLDVAGWPAFVAAVDEVLASGRRAAASGLAVAAPDARMAVLVQPQLDPRWGGVLFGADPVTGRADRLLVSAVEGGPDSLVSGQDDGWTATLSPRGRVLEVRNGDASPLPRSALRALAGLARRAAAAFGGPQDVEWAIDQDGTLWLLQSRPITTPVGTPVGPVLGTGPVAETFPDPLSRLEVDLWLTPLREGLDHALLLTGSASARALRRSPVVRSVDGWAAADLGHLGLAPARHRLLARLDPRGPARRLGSAWRTGRLRRALPLLARDVIEQVDADLAAVPRLGDLSNTALLAVLDNGRTALRALHGYEALAGMLIPDLGHSVTAASLAMSALAEAQAEDVDIDELVETHPVVLALTPPRVGACTPVAAPDLRATAPVAHEPAPSDAAVVREGLRLRARWVQELTARAAWELGRRLVCVGLLPTQDSVRLLGLAELRAAAIGRTLPDDLHERNDPATAGPRALPPVFRLTTDHRPVPVPPPGGGAGAPGTGAGGGRGTGPVHLGSEPPDGAVLVVTHLDPRLATVVPHLAGLVAETGSPLSHLAILAREHGVPTVVGHAGATDRFRPGDLAEVDGSAGTVRLLAAPPLPDPLPDDAPVVDLTAIRPLATGAQR
ncbi:MAG TPA: PEP/pyruvate-binding domain-containing protein [Acidimicrobiales bacterium]|nr:PEP/pyruvate-binding domain-containing protein [Acidimicrobiales bacterium]